MLAPRNLDELNDIILDCGLLDKNYSKDTLRIVLSTLKAAGCQISRPSKSNNNKYVLYSHPFKLEISNPEITALKTVFTNIMGDGDCKKVIQFDLFIKKLCSQIDNEQTVAKLLAISPFKRVKDDVYKIVLEQIDKHNIFKISYLSPSKKTSVHELIFSKVFIKSNKAYLEGQDVKTSKVCIFNLDRVKAIYDIREGDKIFVPSVYSVKYKLKNISKHIIQTNQQVVESTDDGVIILGEFSNKFFAIQHCLALGEDCTVLEPKECREEIIKKLMELENVYK